MSSQHLQNNHGNPQIQKQQRGPQSCYLCFLHTHVKILKKGHTCTFGRNICQPNCKQCHKYYKQRKRDMERKASAEEQNQSANLLGPPIEQQQGQQFIGISIAENNMHCPANFIVSNLNFVPPNFCQYQHAAPPNHTAFPAKKHRIQCQKPIENHNLLFLQSSESEPPPTPQYLLQQHFPAENHSGLQLSESPPSQYIQEHFPFEKRSEEIEENDEAIQFMGIAKREKFDDGGNSNASKRRKIRNEINECFPNEINKCTDNIASAEQKIHLGEANDLIKVLKSAIDLLEKNLASTSASTSILDQNASSVNTNIQQGQKRQQNDGIAQTKINKRNELTSKNANLRPCILLDAVATEGEYDGPMDLSVQRT